MLVGMYAVTIYIRIENACSRHKRTSSVYHLFRVVLVAIPHVTNKHTVPIVIRENIITSTSNKHHGVHVRRCQVDMTINSPLKIREDIIKNTKERGGPFFARH